MTSAQFPDLDSEGDVASVYGEDVAAAQIGERREFKPWHHPVKQFVRREQWKVQLVRLLNGNRQGDGRIRYLTLPGADLLDVRYLGKELKQRGHVLEFLGFDTSAAGDAASEKSSQIDAESVLRQEGIISDNSLTLPDRLQDIALPQSQAANQLKQWRPFDVINLDVCGHFSDSLQAVERLVQHQRTTDKPWLLLLTTRVHPDTMGVLTQHFNAAIDNNLRLSHEFREALALLVESAPQDVDANLQRAWANHNSQFVKLYAVGMGKHLLHLCHNQIQDPARVELKSCLAYRVFGNTADMLSVAFLIQPGPKMAIPANADATVHIQAIEAAHAVQICRKANALGDADELIENSLEQCVEETEELLAALNYDLESYRQWIQAHPERPVRLD